MSDGEFVSGANVENASFPVGMCAERCAVAKAVVCMSLLLLCWVCGGCLF